MENNEHEPTADGAIGGLESGASGENGAAAAHDRNYTAAATDPATVTATDPAPYTAPQRERLTHSRMACARRCLRQHYYRYELGLVRDSEAQALRFGKAFHLGLEVWRSNPAADEARQLADAAGVPHDELPLPRLELALAAALSGYDTPPAWADPEEWAVERETLSVLLQGYFWRYQEDPLETLAVEQAFELPLKNSETGGVSRTFFLAGKIDALVRWDDGNAARQFVLETKTTGEDISADSAYWTRLRVDPQISLYVLAACELGYEPAAVLYDVTRKPTIRPCQIPLVDDDGVKIVRDSAGERVRTKDGKKWRETGDASLGYVLQTRKETASEYGERLWKDIVGDPEGKTEEARQGRPDFYYQRREIPRLEDDLAEFRAEIWQQAGQLRDCQRQGRWFRNVGPFSCGHCEFSELCLQSIRLEPGQVPAGFVLLEDKFPELGQ